MTISCAWDKRSPGRLTLTGNAVRVGYRDGNGRIGGRESGEGADGHDDELHVAGLETVASCKAVVVLAVVGDVPSLR